MTKTDLQRSLKNLGNFQVRKKSPDPTFILFGGARAFNLFLYGIPEIPKIEEHF